MKKRYYILILLTSIQICFANGTSIPSLFKDKNKSILDKTNTISATLLGSPYEEFLLGEGYESEFVKKPVWSINKFDCLTYVETVLALSFAKNERDFDKIIQDIKYHNTPKIFENRNHFTNIDWNRSNQRKGYTKDITIQVAGTKVKTLTTPINRPMWYKFLATKDSLWHRYSGSHLTTIDSEKLLNIANRTKAEQSIIDYIPVELLIKKEANIFSNLKKIPNVTVIEFIRKDWNTEKALGTKLDISHIGFLINKNDTLILRHASQVEQKVTEIELKDYLMKEYNKNILGINIQSIKLS